MFPAPDQGNPTQIPRWLWRGANWSLIAVLALGGVLATMLATGLADPPRAGPLIWSADLQNATQFGVVSPGPLSVQPKYTIRAYSPFGLPAYYPYTLEVSARFTADSDPVSAWDIVLENIGGEVLTVRIRSQGLFSGPPVQPDSIPFIHIRHVGDVNRLALTIDVDGQALLRINDEIAWHAWLSTTSVPLTAYIRVHGGETTLSQFILQRVALYGPNQTIR